MTAAANDDPLRESAADSRYERLIALLIGLIAIVAAVLVVLQSSASLDEARANSVARRLASELTTRLIASGSLTSYAGINSQRAWLVGMEGNARAIVALNADDAAQRAVAEATVAASARLADIAATMGAAPDETSPLDPFARSVLATTDDELYAILKVQNAAADAAGIASDRSSRAVMGLSLAALAGVMAGLAAVMGPCRSGRALLAMGWICAGGAIGLLLLARGVVP